MHNIFMSLAQLPLHIPMYFVHILHHPEITINTTINKSPIQKSDKTVAM